MTFASLEEAWGVPAFGDPGDKPPQTQEPAAPPQQREFPTAYEHGSRRQSPSPPRQAALEDPGEEERVARGVLERAFRTRGTAGVLELLPKDCQRQVVGAAAVATARRAPMRRRRMRRRRQWRRPSWMRRVSEWLSDPNVLILLLVAAFVIMMTWDSRPSDALPNIASLHMSPFPLGSSA